MADYCLCHFWKEIVFWLVAVGFSLFYGINCWTIHELDCEPRLSGLTQRWQLPWKQLWHQKTWGWKVHQLWLKFFGSFVGWYALWTFWHERHHPIAGLDVVLLAIAFLGMTGLIPHASRYGSKIIHDITSR